MVYDRANRIPVIARNCSNNDETRFETMQSASKTLNINQKTIKKICEGRRGYKSAVSPFTNIEFEFYFANDQIIIEVGDDIEITTIITKGVSHRNVTKRNN